MPVSIDEATEIAEFEMNKIADRSNDDYSLLYDEVIEYTSGWVFFYDSTDYVRSGNFISKLAGNVPLYVTKNGECRFLSLNWEDDLKGIEGLS